MTKYKDTVKSFNKHMDSLEYWLNTNTEKGVAHIPEGILESVVEDYKVLCEFDTQPIIHAHWTEQKIPNSGIFDYSFKCNHCHCQTPERAYIISPNYCPNCGAKMDGKDGERE